MRRLPTCERQPAVLSNKSAPLDPLVCLSKADIRLLRRQILEAGIPFEAMDRGQPNRPAKAGGDSAQWKIQHEISVLSSKKFCWGGVYIAFSLHISLQTANSPHVRMACEDLHSGGAVGAVPPSSRNALRTETATCAEAFATRPRRSPHGEARAGGGTPR